MKDWDKDRSGQIRAFPLAGYQTGAISPLGLLRLEYYESEQAFDARRVSAVQLHMSADQATELAQVLLRMSGTLRQRPDAMPQ